MFPRRHGLGRSLRFARSKSHTTNVFPPPVTSCLLDVLRNRTQRVNPGVGVPQMALPVSTSQITRELSSCPPSDARYRPSCENDSSATFTLCRLMRCTMVRACRSQTIMSALNPMLVICPDARNAPSREIARQETSSLCPCRNDCEYVSPSSFTTIVAPRGYAIVLPFGCKTSPPPTFPANPTTDSRGRWSVMAIADERKRGSASVRTRSRRGASPNARESMCRRPARSSITPREGAKTGARRKRAVISLVARDSRLSRKNRTKKALERPPPVSRRIRERHQRLATTRARVSRSLGRRKTPRADHQHRDRLTPHGRAEARDPWLQIARRGRAVLDCFPPWRSGARETSAGS